MSLYDVHKVSENLVLGVLRELCGWRGLRNLNEADRVNFPGIDLADDELGIAIQVTASASLAKVKATIETFVAHGLDARYPRLIVYVLSRKQRSYSQSAIDKVSAARICMDVHEDIMDFRDVCALAAHTDPERLAAALAVVKSFMQAREMNPHQLEIKVDPRTRTPPNLLENVIPGTPADTVRKWLGTPRLVEGDTWSYRYLETQVEITMANNNVVHTIVVALLFGETYYGTGAPWGDFTLGELTLADLAEMGHSHFEYFESMRTKEVFVAVRVGPAGAWAECICGSLVVFTGVGALAESEFDWDKGAGCLRSDPRQTLINYISKPGGSEPPGFSWFIEG